MTSFEVTRLTNSGDLCIMGRFNRLIVNVDEWRQINDAVLELLQNEEVAALDKLAEEGAY